MRDTSPSAREFPRGRGQPDSRAGAALWHGPARRSSRTPCRRRGCAPWSGGTTTTRAPVSRAGSCALLTISWSTSSGKSRKSLPLTEQKERGRRSRAAHAGARRRATPGLPLLPPGAAPRRPNRPDPAHRLRVQTAQIARAFLSDERTIAQRIVRAKQRLRDGGVGFVLPDREEVPARLPPSSTSCTSCSPRAIRPPTARPGIDEALCQESLRLVRLLTDDERWTSPAAEALRALFCFHVARTPARSAGDGSADRPDSCPLADM